MKNLAGVEGCDSQILVELRTAGAYVSSDYSHHGEVPYTKIGMVGPWTLRRAWYYWIASVDAPENGLPLATALEMHNKPYPDHMYDDERDKMGKYGNSIRVVGHCGCPSPEKWVNDRGTISSYHIDTQEGLNEFVRVVKAVCK
jgi:hypothetical protein